MLAQMSGVTLVRVSVLLSLALLLAACSHQASLDTETNKQLREIRAQSEFGGKTLLFPGERTTGSIPAGENPLWLIQ